MESTEVPVAERVPGLGLVRRIVGEAEIPLPVVIPRVRFQEGILLVGARLDVSPRAVEDVLVRIDELPCSLHGALVHGVGGHRPHSGSDVRCCKAISSEGGSLRPLAWGRFGTVIDVDDVRAFALTLPRTTEALVRDRVKFRVGRIVYLAFSHDETIMGFAFPRDEREALVRSEPHKFLMPDRADLRYQWVQVRLDAIDEDEMRELVLDAWRMVVPKRVAAEHAARG